MPHRPIISLMVGIICHTVRHPSPATASLPRKVFRCQCFAVILHSMIGVVGSLGPAVYTTLRRALGIALNALPPIYHSLLRFKSSCWCVLQIIVRAKTHPESLSAPMADALITPLVKVCLPCMPAQLPSHGAKCHVLQVITLTSNYYINTVSVPSQGVSFVTDYHLRALHKVRLDP